MMPTSKANLQQIYAIISSYVSDTVLISITNQILVDLDLDKSTKETFERLGEIARQTLIAYSMDGSK